MTATAGTQHLLTACPFPNWLSEAFWMVAGPCWHRSVGMIGVSNFCPFRRKHDQFRKGNGYFSDAARSAPVRYLGELQKRRRRRQQHRNLPCGSCTPLQTLAPHVRGCGFGIQHTRILLQHVSDLGNKKSCGCALGSLPGAQYVGGRASCCAG